MIESSPCVASSPWNRKGRFFGILGLGSPTRRSGDSGDEDEEEEEEEEPDDEENGDDQVACLPRRHSDPLSPIEEVDTTQAEGLVATSELVKFVGGPTAELWRVDREANSPLIEPGVKRKSEHPTDQGWCVYEDTEIAAVPPELAAVHDPGALLPLRGAAIPTPAALEQPMPESLTPAPAPALVRHVPPMPATLVPTPATPQGAGPLPSSSSVSTASSHLVGKKTVHVNGIPYAQLKTLGKGGSSKVYLVRNSSGEELALKKVVTDNCQAMSEAERRSRSDKLLQVYKEEIDLLLKLRGHERVIQVMDSEVDFARGTILIVMETGDHDLFAHLCANPRLPLRDVQVLWRQMLEAVQVIHETRIIHNDLKPANFLMVKGQLKVIDFGIAKQLDNDTTNVIANGQGTMSYMAPEAAAYVVNQSAKIGRSADVWALGIILYQIVYGQTPYQDLERQQRLNKLNDQNSVIELSTAHRFSDHPVQTQDAVMDVLRRCLQRDPKSRPKLPELLAHPFLFVETAAARHAERLVSLRAQRSEMTAQMQALDLEIEAESRLMRTATTTEGLPMPPAPSAQKEVVTPSIPSQAQRLTASSGIVAGQRQASAAVGSKLAYAPSSFAGSCAARAGRAGA